MQSLQSATAIIAAVLHENCESENLRKLARLDTEREGECLLRGIDWSGYELHAGLYPRNDQITTILLAPPSELAAAKDAEDESHKDRGSFQLRQLPALQAVTFTRFLIMWQLLLNTDTENGMG